MIKSNFLVIKTRSNLKYINLKQTENMQEKYRKKYCTIYILKKRRKNRKRAFTFELKHQQKNMASIIPSMKDIISIKFKKRNDSYSDQYSRIFMVKMLLISTLLIGLNWYSDKVTCIVSKKVEMSDTYISNACWIQGFYIYDDVKAAKNTVAHYGIPNNLDFDGRYDTGKFCIANTPRNYEKDEDCKPLRKIFYIQYQYMVFLIAALALLYYLPYLLFTIINNDIISLKHDLEVTETEDIVLKYFNYAAMSNTKLRIKTCCNVIIKVLYVVVNIAAFITLDNALNGQFAGYAVKWTSWLQLVNYLKYDYMGQKEEEKPGNLLLPTFGICEIHEGSRDVRATITDKHKFICEFSQHVLYQYVLIVLWFLFVVGIVISVAGLLTYLLEIIFTFGIRMFQKKGAHKAKTYREHEYLETIRQKNMSKYKDIIDKLSTMQETFSKENSFTYKL